MPGVVDDDALAFAGIRATHLLSPRQVADDLVAAAAEPATRLTGVTPLRVRLRAAEILRGSGDLDGALGVLESSADNAAFVPDFLSRFELASASVLVADGDIGAAQAAVGQIRAWPVSDSAGLATIIGLLLCAADRGYFEQAHRWADAAQAAAACADHFATEMSQKHIATVLHAADEQVWDLQQQANVAGADGNVPAQGQPGHSREVARGAESAGSAAWPALVGGRLLWWPAAEYERLVRQVPALRGVLGATWPEHTAKIQAAMTAFQNLPLLHASHDLSLTPASFRQYGQFLDRTGADPRLPEILTAFTSHAGAGYQHPAPWPPRRGAPCWCGSGRKYLRCHGDSPG